MCNDCESILREISRVIKDHLLHDMTEVRVGANFKLTAEEVLQMFQDELDHIKADVDDIRNGRIQCHICGKVGMHEHDLAEFWSSSHLGGLIGKILVINTSDGSLSIIDSDKEH